MVLKPLKTSSSERSANRNILPKNVAYFLSSLLNRCILICNRTSLHFVIHDLLKEEFYFFNLTQYCVV